jgi:hypothetical protein
MGGHGIRQATCAVVALGVVACWFPLGVSAGWVIEQIEYANPGAEGTRTLQYISKRRLRTEGDGHTFIMDFVKNLFIATDQENRVYWSGTVDEYVREVQRFQQAATHLAQQQMEEARESILREIDACENRSSRIAHLRELREDFVGFYGWIREDELEDYTPEQRHGEYRDLELRVEARSKDELEVSGVFGTEKVYICDPSRRPRLTATTSS